MLAFAAGQFIVEIHVALAYDAKIPLNIGCKKSAVYAERKSTSKNCKPVRIISTVGQYQRYINMYIYIYIYVVFRRICAYMYM